MSSGVRRMAVLIAAGLSVFALVALPRGLEAAAPSLGHAAEQWQRAHPGSPVSDRIEDHKHFRSQFDFLDQSDDAVAVALVSGITNGSANRWGIEMTDEELAEMNRRDSIQQHFPQIAGAAVGDDWSEALVEGLDPEGSFGAFGGRWIDQMDGGKLVIAMVRDHPEYTEAMGRAATTTQQIAAAGGLAVTDVKYVAARFSADELYAVNADFAREFIETGSKAQMAASMNPVGNRVDLYVEPAWATEAESFAKAYPVGLVAVEVVPEGTLAGHDAQEPDDDWGAGNWHAGAFINITRNTGDEGTCSWGATARTTSYLYVVTAAHCLGYDGPGHLVESWWNDSTNTPLSQRRGVRTWGGNDTISNANGHTYVVIYNGPRGDLARLSISDESMLDSNECLLENEVHCGKRITRRELTTETEVNDVKCMPTKTRGPVCAVLTSNDAPVSGYDFLRLLNTHSTNHVDDGDSGGAVHESTLHTGIIKGHFNWTYGYDSYFTHSYYIEASSYLDASKVCGTTGICDN